MEHEGRSLAKGVVYNLLLTANLGEDGDLPVHRNAAESRFLRYEEGLREARRDGKMHLVIHGNLDVTAHDSPVPGATGRQQQGGADQSNCQPFHFLGKFI